MRFLSLVTAVCFSAILGAAEPALEEKSELDGKVTLLIPKGFKPMEEKMLKFKYPLESRPTLVYTNERGSVNVALNHTKNRMPAEKLEAFHKSIEGVFKKTHPTAKWFRSEIATINERKYFVIEMRTTAIDTEVRNIIMGTSLDDRLMMISFNCTKELEEQWLPAGVKVIESIKIK